jgi:aspartyl-tRNA synthetase
MTIDILENWRRTHDCGSLRVDDAGTQVLLMGWVNVRRDLGSLIFVDLRDRGGITQIVFDPAVNGTAHEKARVLRSEWVIAVKGKVSPRLAGQENKNLPTGGIEIQVTELKILNSTEVPPFQIEGTVDASETLRLKYRYLELRRPKIFDNFMKRHRIVTTIRDCMNRNGFIEVETPFLTKSTPEGARDYLVPSRVNKGMFYALPQSPQLFKQLLMVAGFDRYYQVARCFRDEDLRADRQPEFTQVDMEMSFAGEDDVMAVFEEMMKDVFKDILEKDITTPILRLEYAEAMERFGSDKPDMRFGMELKNISDIAARSDFSIFKSAVENGGCIKAINVKKVAADFSRKVLDDLNKFTTDLGAKGLAWIKVQENDWQSPIAKFFNDNDRVAINQKMDAKPGDLILAIADKTKTVNQALGMLRIEVAKRLNIINKDLYSFLWVTKFPLLEYDEKEGRLQAVHHPFTAPLDEDVRLLKDTPDKVRARAYDLVLNGVEIGGGSVRIHNMSMQDEMFKILGISREDADRKFGFFLEALKYGAPPHAGMAIGLDRLTAIIAGVDSIREVIAFPKTSSASCLMSEAPSTVEESQLKELNISLL